MDELGKPMLCWSLAVFRLLLQSESSYMLLGDDNPLLVSSRSTCLAGGSPQALFCWLLFFSCCLDSGSSHFMFSPASLGSFQSCAFLHIFNCVACFVPLGNPLLALLCFDNRWLMLVSSFVLAFFSSFFGAVVFYRSMFFVRFRAHFTCGF